MGVYKWKFPKLSEIAVAIESGKRPKGGVGDYLEGIPSLGGEHLDSDGGFKFGKIKFVPPAFATSMKKGFIKPGDILLVKDGATTGKVSFVGAQFPYTNAVINEHLFIIRLPENINKKWVFYYLWSHTGRQQILEDFKGAAQGGISNKFADYVRVPLPPIEIQNQLVEKIERDFSLIDAAVNSLSLALCQLDIFTQSVRDAEFKKLSKNIKLQDLLSIKLSNGYSGKPVKYETKTKVLSLSATTAGVFDPSHFKYLDEAGLEDRDIWCAPGDILMQRGNTKEYVGVSAIYSGPGKEFIFPDLMIRIRANQKIINTEYLYHALSSPRVRNEMRVKAKGSAGTMPKINQSILQNLEIPYCEPSFQLQITNRIEERLSNAASIYQLSEVGIKKSSILKNSILGKIYQQHAPIGAKNMEIL